MTTFLSYSVSNFSSSLYNDFGIDVSDKSLRKAVEDHNEICKLITEIGEYRKEDNPKITGYGNLCMSTLFIDR